MRFKIHFLIRCCFISDCDDGGRLQWISTVSLNVTSSNTQLLKISDSSSMVTCSLVVFRIYPSTVSSMSMQHLITCTFFRHDLRLTINRFLSWKKNTWSYIRITDYTKWHGKWCLIKECLTNTIIKKENYMNFRVFGIYIRIYVYSYV